MADKRMSWFGDEHDVLCSAWGIDLNGRPRLRLRSWWTRTYLETLWHRALCSPTWFEVRETTPQQMMDEHREAS